MVVDRPIMFDRLKHRVVERLDLPRIARRADTAADAVVHHESAIADLDRRQHESEHAASHRDDRVDAVHRWMRIEQTTNWARTAPLVHRPTISVITPTRDRAERLRSAIDSVLAQSYTNWELVVVDDGSTDSTAEFLSSLAADEPRLVVRTTAGLGAAAARNVGLGAATGSWVAFLDDDNTMQADWLRAIAEYSGRDTACRAMFGAQLRDDVLGGDVVPWLLFDEQPTLQRLRRDNTIDLNALAVVADHAELRFDEELDLYIDWEMVVRIFAATPIHPVAVLASTYSSGAKGRITDRHGEQTLERMRLRLAE